MSIFQYNNFFLVGIKGVAMTAIAQILIDAKKTVSGSDLKEDFVTKKILDQLNLNILVGFESEIPEGVDCVIYTAAHNAQLNPQVINACHKNLKVYSHARAQAEFFNQKKGVAVCGVGGKSTVSAMIAFILETTGRDPSYAVGVGNIPGLNRTARWDSDTDIFVAEADEYVTDPSATSRGEEITPRFSYLKPFTTICTNLKFDHPDVYKDFSHTKKVFFSFFNQISQDGFLILNYQDLIHNPTTSAQTTLTFGNTPEADFYYQEIEEEIKPGINVGSLLRDNQDYKIILKIPGLYNLENAVAAIAACSTVDVPINESIDALKSFNSTQRRFELIGEKNGITFYDDYAHHPDEIRSVISALNKWYPTSRKIIAFQPHTYSRTKQFLTEFVDSFQEADEVMFTDIFASAREKLDLDISSSNIVEGIQNKFPKIKTANLKTNSALADYFKNNINPGDIALTIGAGDIYKVHDLIQR